MPIKLHFALYSLPSRMLSAVRPEFQSDSCHQLLLTTIIRAITFLPRPVPTMRTDNSLTQEMEGPPETWTFSLSRKTLPLEESGTALQCAGILDTESMRSLGWQRRQHPFKSRKALGIKRNSDAEGPCGEAFACTVSEKREANA